jgi:hypothetical protein
LEPVSRAK